MNPLLLNPATAFLWLLCVATAFGWVRSINHLDNVGFERMQAFNDSAEVDLKYARSSRGAIEVGRQTTRYFDPAERSLIGAQKNNGWRWFMNQQPFGSYKGLYRELSVWERLGFDRDEGRSKTWDEDRTRVLTTHEVHTITVPYSFLMIVLARAAARSSGETDSFTVSRARARGLSEARI